MDNKKKYIENELRKARISKKDFILYLKMKKINKFVTNLNKKHKKKVDLDFYLDIESTNIESTDIESTDIESTYVKSDNTESNDIESNNIKSESLSCNEIIKPRNNDNHIICYFEKNENGIVVRNILNSDEYKLYQISNQDKINSLLKCSDIYDRFFYITFQKKMIKNNVSFINISGLIELDVKFTKGITKHVKDGKYCFIDDNNKYSSMDDYIFKQYENKKLGMYYINLDMLRSKPKIKDTKNIYVIKLGEI
jgi:hypothetical protein